jgi:hypothetical protein
LQALPASVFAGQRNGRSACFERGGVRVCCRLFL